MATPSVAQDTPAALSLTEAIDRAMTANPAIVAARLQDPVLKAGLLLAGERPNPEVAVEFARETPRQGFGVALPIELGGKRAKRMAVSQATVRSGAAGLAATVAQVRNDVRRAYVEVLVADAQSGVLQELRDVSRRVRDAARARFDAGDAPRLEVLQAELALGAADNDVLASRGASLAARTRMNALLGQPLELAQPLSTPLEPEAAIGATAAVELARASSTELALLDRQIDEQRARLTLAHAVRIPDLVPSVTLTHDAQPEFSYGWRAGVAITLPIFASRKAGVLVEQASLDQVRAQRQAAMSRITGEVTAVIATLEAQQQAYARYRDVILPQAQEVEQLAQESYQLGQTDIAALLQALQASRDLRLRALDAVLQLQMSRADLERAIGGPLP